MALSKPLEAIDGDGPRPGGIADRARARQGQTRYLDGLNTEQREAVEAIDGPVLVLAGAGTGKTRVLTTRIAHILAAGRARAHEILAVTFTNKAAREMKERVATLAGPVAEGMPWLGTFHAVSTKILRRHAELVGLKSGFTILDTDDQIRLLKQVIQAANIDDKRWPARALANQIDGWKNRGLDPAHVPAGEASAFANGRGGELYRAYQDRLKTLNATDFGDLLLESVRLFREHPDVLQTYQERFRFMLVDEYQDTNTVQYLWLKLLAQGRHNVCCVGDDDQSIYGWRGAEVDNILRFEKDFPGAKVVRWSATIAPPGTSSPRPRTSSRATKAGSARRCSPTARTATRQPSPGSGTRRRRRARSASRSSSCSARATRSTRWRSSCAPRFRCASSRNASLRSACPTG